VKKCSFSERVYGPVWDERDAFDDILQKFFEVNEDNCAIKHVGDLKMPEDTVSHLPDIKEININPVFPNRTALLHLHDMALNRYVYVDSPHGFWYLDLSLRYFTISNPATFLSSFDP